MTVGGDTTGWVPGGTESRADSDALGRFVDLGATAREEMAEGLGPLRRLQGVVQAGCGRWAIGGDAISDATRLLQTLDDNEQMVASVRRQLLQADSSPVPGSDPTLSRPGSLVGLAGVGARGRAQTDRAGVSGRIDMGGRTPWLDPNSDSWVVNLARAGRQRPMSPSFLRRLGRDGPGFGRQLLTTGLELSPLNQHRLALTQPTTFAANWARAGQSGLKAFADLALAGIGATALALPYGDQSFDAVFGRRPGHELALALEQAAQLVIADPDSLAEAQLGWDQLQSDPYRWMGAMAPDVAAELVTLWGGGAVTRASRAARGSRSVTTATKRLTETTLAETVLTEAPVADIGTLARHLGHAEPPRRLPDLATFRRAESEWAEADPIVSHRAGPHESPERWVADINGGGKDLPGRDVNCIDCTRAVEANWRGHDAVAAPLGPSLIRGTSATRLEDWIGGHLVVTSIDDVEARLIEMGPGSSAMVVSTWQARGAHAFNAVNDGGIVKWVDGQFGKVAQWPPPYVDNIADSHAIFIGPDAHPR
jgi:hypothetical protein